MRVCHSFSHVNSIAEALLAASANCAWYCWQMRIRSQQSPSAECCSERELSSCRGEKAWKIRNEHIYLWYFLDLLLIAFVVGYDAFVDFEELVGRSFLAWNAAVVRCKAVTGLCSAVSNAHSIVRLAYVQ